MSTSLAWEEDFPNGFGHTSIAYLKRCSGYEEAKNGDIEAAQFVAAQCVKQKRIHELREQYPKAVLLPVLGKNKLPLALAKFIGLPVLYTVWICKSIPRKVLRSMDRFIYKPGFIGYIREGVSYILVDDVVTQGGTVSALREFVMIRGGKVVAVVALAYSIGSHAVAPLKKYKIRLFVKFGFLLAGVLQEFNITSEIYALTNSQIKYLLRFSSVASIKKRLGEVDARLCKLS